MKTCGRCRETLPVAEFSRHKRSDDGLQAWCKKCQRVAAKVRREQLAARPEVTPPDHKRCPRCATVKPASAYHRSRSALDGLQPYCAECSVAVRREWEERHADAVAAKRSERLLRGANLTEGVKTCTKCGQEKPRLSFYLHRATADGRSTHCADCQKAVSRARRAAQRDRVRQQNAAWAAANPERKRRDYRQWWLKMYGLTPDDYAALLAEQDGVCAICLLPERYIDARTGEPRRLSVDHDHATGKVRGLLCGRCNRSIAQFDEDHERLTRAAHYLERAADEGVMHNNGGLESRL